MSPPSPLFMANQVEEPQTLSRWPFQQTTETEPMPNPVAVDSERSAVEAKKRKGLWQPNTEPPPSRTRNWRRCDVPEVTLLSSPGLSTEGVGQNAWQSQSHLCAPFRLTALTYLASIAPRDINAEIGAFMTPKFCGSSSRELGHPSRPSSDRYSRRLWGSGSRRECGMSAPGTSWSGSLWAADGGVLHRTPGRRGAGAGEGAIPGGGFRGGGVVVHRVLSSFMS